MTSEDKRILKLFQSEDNRLKEQEFSRGFTRNDEVCLAFINEGRAFTDGINITVDPAMDKIFSDDNALRKTSEKLGFTETITDRWTALFLTTRAQEIHECLHIIYTQFPPPALRDKRSTDRIRTVVLAMVDNIIEDAYIENIGVSEYPETEVYLRWGRVSHLYADSPEQGTLSEALSFTKDSTGEKSEEINAVEYILDYCAAKLLYPMTEIGEPLIEYAPYIDKVYPLFYEGSLCGTPAKRHEYACMIFDILEPMLPDCIPEFQLLGKMLGGAGTHGISGKSLGGQSSDGQEAEITRRLFTDFGGNMIEFDKNGEIVSQLINDCADEYSEQNDAVMAVVQPYYVTIPGSQTGAAVMHREIKIKEYHPIPDALLEKSYRMTQRQFSRIINNYKRRFERLIHTEVEYTERKKYFGAGISSKDLTDVKKRYWYRTYHEESTPELAVMLMIDGSGSMRGARRNAAVQASVILHEVLESHSIEHCIVEHRAIYDEPLVEHNILLDFNHRTRDKFNIMRLSADHGTREGLSLYWAQRYIENNSSAENKVIIVISDGLPAHECSTSSYYPPVSTMDTSNATNRISHSGTKIVAAALGSDCYSDLKEIYPKTVECSELEKLPAKLLKMVSDELNR